MYPYVHAIDAPLVHLISPLIDEGPWIAGGAVRRWFDETPAGFGDIDVFCKNQHQADVIASRLRNTQDVSVVHESANAITFSVFPAKPEIPAAKIQIIIKQFYESAEDVISNFDLTVAQFVTDGYSIRVGPRAVADLKHKRIRFNRQPGPSDLPRIIKYIAYGFRIEPSVFRQIIDRNDVKWGDPAEFKMEEYENI